MEAKLISALKKLKKTKDEYRDKRIHMNKILILGGFGYNNAGDEAQLDAVLERLKEWFPLSLIKVLSPNPDITYINHSYCNVDFAPRVAFFRVGESKLYSIKDKSQCSNIISKFVNNFLKLGFLVKSWWIYMNALLEKYNLPIFLLSSQAAGLIYDIRSSRLVYFDGGGYLTGKTLSRLWDGILICNIAKLYNIPVVMSGQTIGVWRTKFNQFYAKKAFSYANIITLRDINESKKELKLIGIDLDKVYPACDDALFCTKEESIERLSQIIEKSGIDINILNKGYLVENIHDWGMLTDKEIYCVLEKLHIINRYIIEQNNLDIIFIPMTPTDVEMMERYNNLYEKEQIKILKYNYDYKIIRGIIAKSRCCITMKHHPIIFSIGEKIPCISLNYTDYYVHKNGGALDILGVKEFSINLEDSECIETFIKLYSFINENYSEIQERIEKILYEKKEILNKFKRELIELLSNQ